MASASREKITPGSSIPGTGGMTSLLPVAITSLAVSAMRFSPPGRIT